MCSLLRGHEEVNISENVQFLLTQYDEDDKRTQEDFCYDKVAASLAHSSPEKAISLRFWRAVHHCGLTSFLDTSLIPSISELLTSYDPSPFNGKTQLQLLAVAYGRRFQSLERAKALLAMSCTQHLRAVQQQQCDAMIQAIETLASGQKDILQRLKPAAIVQRSVHTNGAVAVTDRSKKLKRIFEVHTPKWMNSNIWHLALDRSICGWQFTMRTYGVVPRNAPIIMACLDGDTVGMQRLFDIGAASPFDQTPEGFELVSVSHHQAFAFPLILPRPV